MPIRTHHVAAALCLLLAGLGAQHASAREKSVGLVTIETGDLPIILSAPHGGRDAIPGVPERQGQGVGQFVRVSDTNTDRLTERLADVLEKKLGKRPYVVIARFHRKYLDVNRRARDAFESPNARAVYNTYHEALAKNRRDVIDRWGRGILLDIHGQGAERDVVFRGTQNGNTTTYLVNRFGREALIGETSLFGRLADQGVPVIPATGSTDREHPRYGGGYIVQTYGSGSGGTLDAIQLEFGRELRSTEAIPSTASKMANAIAAFTKDYLPKAALGSKMGGKDQREEKSLVGANAASGVGRHLLFSDDFTDGDRGGWFEVDDDSSTLSVKSESGQLSSLPELSFTASDTSSLKSFATHFPEVKLKRAGDYVTLQFDARHNNAGFVNRGFRFGLFDSGGTRFVTDGDLDSNPISLDDNGYFVILDLGSRTRSDSTVIRETDNPSDERLWDGATIAFDDNDSAPDPLMFTRDKNYTYTLTLTRDSGGSIAIVLKNHVSGEDGALTGTSKLTPALTLDTIYFGIHGSTADFAIDNVIVSNNGTVAAQSPTEKIRVGVYFDEGAGASVKDLLFTLGKCEDVSIKRLKADDIRAGALADLDVLIHPGGSGSSQGRHLGEDGREMVRKFIHEGGGFIGICAGAYLASADYEWSLHVLDAKVLDRQHWARGKGMVEITLTDVGQDALRTPERQLAIYYGQGPLLAPHNDPDIADYETIATYKTEIAKNGAPEGVMKGATAIAGGQYGRGRVFCFSPHPEMTRGLEPLVHCAIEYVKRSGLPK